MSHGQPQSSSTHSQKCQLSFSSIFQTPFHVLLRLFCIFFIELKLNYRCSLLGLNINISLLILLTSCQLSYSIMFRIFRLWLRIHINLFHNFSFCFRNNSSLFLSFYFNVIICHLLRFRAILLLCQLLCNWLRSLACLLRRVILYFLLSFLLCILSASSLASNSASYLTLYSAPHCT